MRVGLIGAGLMGHTHARAWATLPGVLRAVYTPDDNARTFARQYGLKGCGTLEELYAEADIIDICTPTPTHLALTLAAARAGRHVICEKPVALNVHDAAEMERACDEAGVRLFIAHVLRFFPQYRATRERLRRGEIGSLRVLRLSRVSSPPAAGSWLHDEAQSGGVPLDLMLHDLDYARWLAGEVGEVYAVQASAEGRTTVQATLSHVSGALSLVEGGWAAPDGVFRTSLDVAGTKGAIEWTSDAPAALRRHGAATQAAAQAGVQAGVQAASQAGAALPALDGNPYADELQHAHHAISHGSPFLVTAHDALRAVEIAQAVRASLRSGLPVRLESQVSV